MSKETRSIDKKGFSNKFFEELDKEHDNAKEFAKRQKELKEKKKKQSWFWLFYTDFISSLQPDWGIFLLQVGSIIPILVFEVKYYFCNNMPWNYDVLLVQIFAVMQKNAVALVTKNHSVEQIHTSQM